MSITVWTWPELVNEAGGRRQAERLLREMQVWRVMHGAYVGAEHPDTPDVRLAALDHVAPAHAVLSGRTALWAQGVDLGSAPSPVELAVPRGLQLRKRTGVRIRSMECGDADVVQLEGRLALSPARAVVDIARFEGLVEGVAIADAALRAGVTSAPLIEGALARAHGLRGVVAARSIVDHLEPRSESLMESRVRMTLVRGGIPRPEAQVDFYDGWAHVGRADLFLDGVVFEYDGFEVHDRRKAFARDRQRANGLTAGGLVVVRFTSDDYYNRPRSLIVGAARSALAQARGRSVTLERGRDTLRPPRLSPPRTLAELAAEAA